MYNMNWKGIFVKENVADIRVHICLLGYVLQILVFSSNQNLRST